MFDVLDTFIGLITIYLVLSLVVTAIGEFFSTSFNFRGATLFRIVENLVGRGLAYQIISHENVLSLCKLETHGCLQKLLFKPINVLNSNQSKVTVESGDASQRGWIEVEEKSYRLPSYMPPELFARTLLDIVINKENGEYAPDRRKMLTASTIDKALEKAINVDQKSDSMVRLHSMWVDSEYDLERFQQAVIKWFDQTADRANGWFKRRLGKYLLVIGFVVAAALNADTLHMFEVLSSDPLLRKQMVQTAEVLEKTGINDDNSDISKKFENVCNELGINDQGIKGQGIKDNAICNKAVLAKRLFPTLLPVLGWDEPHIPSPAKVCWSASDESCTDKPFVALVTWFFWLLGILLTAGAVSLGAPFWFDLLHKVIQVRGKIATSTSTSSKQPDANKPPAVTEAPRAKSMLMKSATEKGVMDDIMGFDEKSFGYSPLNQLWSARLSNLAYDEEAIVSEKLQEFGAEGTIINHADTDTQCLIVLTPKMVLVAFRGTEQKAADWLTDADVTLIGNEAKILALDLDQNCQVHKGFHQALFKKEATSPSAWDKIYKYLRDKNVFDKNMPIWVTGHSLGGALAVLAAIKLAKSGATIGGLHTFGQPRVGNQAMADQIDATLRHKYFRSINHSDIVPRLPFPKTPDPTNNFKIQEYVHAGRVIYFNDLGQGIIDPPIWYRTIDVLSLDLGFLDKLPDDDAKRVALEEKLAGPKEKLKGLVGDHGMNMYVKLHQSLLFEVDAG